ncbi:CDP-diacylglycerol--glycerol-3-phosphate 3-phosphatidyltransferase [Luteipulveratus halotolerans]|uniref:CDP-diacylglycerol--glycerol-3-phosphate 3-phosphatidyltransferase n=1 Tax=Luteipulveratus halotolerans TaxID=1631356 RepID=A0A0L6CG59_9MICO|nr:CDP-diacylglycerol--glycerol-3-phosphate 3-phosphatidyltransferase [Luteipulveratus halotolerans]KNX36787.1 CDP-diacylglycerol--glycerol-3-phosphate 3-phosphatidyltransferase [Luteipulveratus halotolerans]
MTHGPAVTPDPAAEPSSGVSNWNIANYLTVLRIALVPVFGWLLLADGGDSTGMRVAAFVVFTIASITDRIDGDLARSRGLVTDFGKVVDPIADKALIGMALIGLSLIDEVPWWITVVILVRELGITALRFAVIRHGVMPASRGGKLKTALQAFAIGLFVLPLDGVLHWLAWAILVAALVVTVVTGVDYVLRAVRLRRTSERTAARRARRQGT